MAKEVSPGKKNAFPVRLEAADVAGSECPLAEELRAFLFVTKHNETEDEEQGTSTKPSQEK